MFNLPKKKQGWYLTLNMMYDCKHTKKQRWYHFIFGEPRLTIDFCTAETETEAEYKFVDRGHHFGLFHETIITLREHREVKNV